MSTKKNNVVSTIEATATISAPPKPTLDESKVKAYLKSIPSGNSGMCSFDGIAVAWYIGTDSEKNRVEMWANVDEVHSTVSKHSLVLTALRGLGARTQKDNAGLVAPAKFVPARTWETRGESTAAPKVKALQAQNDELAKKLAALEELLKKNGINA